jgi:heme/copper-type cytochrome/quinol oxidase subunit 2
MNLFSILSNLYLFLVALVITIGILMIILFFSLFNREETHATYEPTENMDIEVIKK